MLKSFVFRKMFLTTGIFIFLLLLYIIPVSVNLKELNINPNIIYVNADETTHDIYLLDKDNYIAKTKVIIEKEGVESLASELIEILTVDGKKNDIVPNNFKATIPKDTKVVSLTFKDNILKVNFTDKFWNVKNVNESKLVESIVYTLTSIEGVTGVMLFVEKNIITNMPSTNHLLPTILNRDIGINKKYNITSTKDINKVTIYYIKKADKTKYYVPVTKYTNDSREKISIIIDELASSTTYESNLMSYLDANTKLISSQIENDVITLNFNSAIMSDFDTNFILEEVIETINLSIKDNFDVQKVIYLVDNKEITNNCLKKC